MRKSRKDGRERGWWKIKLMASENSDSDGTTGNGNNSEIADYTYKGDLQELSSYLSDLILLHSPAVKFSNLISCSRIILSKVWSQQRIPESEQSV